MPFQIIRGSLPLCCCDAVVNPTDEFFSGSGGLDAQIHRAAGPWLREECRTLPELSIGDAALTGAYALPCRAVIHTVAPWWTGRTEELEGLRRCYRSALALALEHDLRDLAFPLIGSGTRGFPKETVLKIAVEELRSFLEAHDDFDILLVVYDRGEFQPSRELLEGLENYRRSLLDEEALAGVADYGLSMPMAKEPEEEPEPPEQSVPLARPESSGRWHSSLFRRGSREEEAPALGALPQEEAPAPVELPEDASAHFNMPVPMPAPDAMPEPFFSTERVVLDESFSEMVMRKIDEAGFKKDSECYVRANIDRRLFSKIRSDIHYHPKKTTAVALAVALQLPLDETRELLGKAGYSLSRSILFDVIVEYCIKRHNYDIFEINELLFEYDQPLLGG